MDAKLVSNDCAEFHTKDTRKVEVNDGEISVNITMFCNQYIDGSKQGVQLSDSKVWKNYIDTYHKVLNGISEKDKEKMIIRM